MDKKQMKSKAKLMEPTIRIGKNGLTETVLEEIRKQLSKKKLIKIKMLKSLADKSSRKKIGEELVGKTNAQLIDQVGFVYVLAKR